MPKNTATFLGSQNTFDFVENLTDFLFGLFFGGEEEKINTIHVLLRFNFCDAANVANSHSVNCSANDIRSNRISFSHHLHSNWRNFSNEN